MRTPRITRRPRSASNLSARKILESHAIGRSGACGCYVARRMYLAPFRTDRRILISGDAPFTFLSCHDHRVQRMTFSRLTIRKVMHQVPFVVNYRYVRAQEADALDCGNITAVLVDASEQLRVPRLDFFSAFIVASVNYDVISIGGKRGGVRLSACLQTKFDKQSEHSLNR